MRKSFPLLALSACLTITGLLSPFLKGAEDGSPRPPYPPSPVIRSITWHWDTHWTAAPGSDLWPVTWGPDGHLYVAWDDGGGFGGSNSDGRVSMGFGRIEGEPQRYRGVNINGGKNPEQPASFPNKGKTGINAHDKFNLVKVTMTLAKDPAP